MNSSIAKGTLVCSLLCLSAAGACPAKAGRMFDGRVAAPASLDRECGYAWQMWQKHPGRGRTLLRWAEMWSAPATDNVAPQDLRTIITGLGYHKTTRHIGSTDAVFKGSEIYFDGSGQSFAVVELFFVGDRMNVLIGGN